MVTTKLNFCFFLFITVLITGCNNKKSSDKLIETIENNGKSKLTTIEQKIKCSSDVKLLQVELAKNYPKKYSCSITPESILKGDINGDGLEDVLFRYSVDDIENQTWLACGWFIAFSNDKNEFENYIYFDWSSGKCAPALFDLGFPTSINDGFISSYIDDYDKDDGCCCPSIKRKMKFTYDKEFNFLSLVNVESIKQ